MKPRGVEKLKDVIDEALLIRLSERIGEVYADFDRSAFVTNSSVERDNKSFFERIIQAANSLYPLLPSDFEQSCSILLSVAPPPLVSEGYGTENYDVLILSRYVSIYGLNNPRTSLAALARLTQSYSAEFDIRPFIEHHPEVTFLFLQYLARSGDFHKRRLASEGCRPRLPLANHLTSLREDPQPCINILQMLRADPIKYVQKSVANNIADILKDNPHIAYKVLSEWAMEKNSITKWIVKRALRKPLHDRDPHALALAKQLC